MNTELTANHGTVEEKKDKLVNDIKGVVSDADSLLKGVASSAVDEFAAARSKIETELGAARSRLHVARIEATRKACDVADATQEYVRDNPWKILGVAALAGLLMGIVLRRR